MSAGPRSDAGARERERSRSLSPGPRAGSPAATLPRLSGARGALPDGGAARSESPFVSPRASELRAERERLLAAAKRVDEEMQLSEKQAREQQALAERIGGELQKAGTPRHGRPETPAGAAHQQSRVGEAPAKQRAEQAQPVIQRALPPQVRVPAPAPAPAAGAGQDARAAAPAAGVGVKVTGETVSAAVAVAAAVMDQHAARTDGQRASGGVPDSGDSQGHPDIGMKSLLETESQALLVMQFSESGSAIMRTDLSRTGLLDECRNDIDPQRRAGTARKLSKSTSYGQLAELEREPPANPRGHDTAAGPHGTSSLAHLHLRDLRYLQGVSDHHIMPRCGALVVSLGLVNVVMTHRNAYFVVPDGADKLLQPMLTRLHKGHRNTESEMPFELRVLEAVLLTLITFHSESVERCLADKTAISEGIKARMGSNMLTQIWKLKNEVFQIIQDIQGCERAVEEVQADKEALALMYMSAMREDPAAYMLLLRSQQGNTEHVQLLLDAYALEFNALSSQLYLVQKEIEATEELLTLQLDVARNNLWKVDILVGMASMWISVALLVSGFFGVNLYESWSEQMTGPFTPLHNATKVVGENPSWAWFDVTIVSGAGALGLILITTFMLWAKGYLVS